jgi:hypothetical protein
MTSRQSAIPFFRSKPMVRRLRNSQRRSMKQEQQSPTTLRLLSTRTKSRWRVQVIKHSTLKRCLLQPSDISQSWKGSISTRCQARAREEESPREILLPLRKESQKSKLQPRHSQPPRPQHSPLPLHQASHPPAPSKSQS